MSSPLIETAKGPLVLLFYDGFEWRAREGSVPRILAQGRRLGRFVYRTVRRRQVFTGFYTAFRSLRLALERHGCDVRVNDFAAARARPDYPIGVAGYPSVLDAVRLPNPVLFGPGDFGDPSAAMAVAAVSRMKLLIQPSDWFRDYYRSACGEKMVTWFAGIDTEAWPDLSQCKKTVDILVYDKIRWHREVEVPALLDRLTAHLDSRGLTWQVLRYGHHHLADFANALRHARSLAFLCEHETQGLAYQEALSSNVPVFAWDEGVFVDPHLAPGAPCGLNVSSVPYFNASCGRTFTRNQIASEFSRFWNDLTIYQPRRYVERTLSLQRSAEAYLELYARAGSAD